MAMLDEEVRTQLSGRTLQVVISRWVAKSTSVDIAQMQEINRMVMITHVPQTLQFMEGVITCAAGSSRSSICARVCHRPLGAHEKHPHHRD